MYQLCKIGMIKRLGVWMILITGWGFVLQGKPIPSDRVLSVNELSDYLLPNVRSELGAKGEVSSEKLAAYFREKFSERYFYDFKANESRLARYEASYENHSLHRSRALEHLNKFAAKTPWLLPFNYLNGKPVDAYNLRHLARQHKMVDLALHYFNDGRDPSYIRYFEDQQASLNKALEKGAYEKIEDGNGVYEAFRAGYRVLNWLQIHTLFLGEEEYSDQDQLHTIATLVQHAAHLYEHNTSFRFGNHQTRGMSALAMLAILLRDFEGADLWYERAMKMLGEHLTREINEDGFQFERSVHYHMSDINNYFYVYQLAQISGMQVDGEWERKLYQLFGTLAKIAYPDKSAPVLQDDTDNPWAETNDISGAMTLGYLLFKDEGFGYFAAEKVDGSMYWFLSQNQLDLLGDIKWKKPNYRSLSFPNTHYYVMREGWDRDDKMLILSAGLDPDKPDHQHGDMLGIQAMANGQVILPNYQVRYSLPDYDLFKNSLVKNVALVDDELQGKAWTGNKGGSGFGKFKELPQPRVIAWKSQPEFDLFVGSHDGFAEIGVDYRRQLIYIKPGFWILKDNFSSKESHHYKQIFQGHFTHEEGPNLIRKVFPDASGCDILQLQTIDHAEQGGTRGKQWTVLSKSSQTQFSFISVIYPYRGYQHRLDETLSIDELSLDGWRINQSAWKITGAIAVSLTKHTTDYFFGVERLAKENLVVQTSSPTDLRIHQQGDQLYISHIGTSLVEIRVQYPTTQSTEIIQLKPGESRGISLRP